MRYLQMSDCPPSAARCSAFLPCPSLTLASSSGKKTQLCQLKLVQWAVTCCLQKPLNTFSSLHGTFCDILCIAAWHILDLWFHCCAHTVFAIL